ncbi:hypothetical protein CA13_66940 [Planctomycetes bacterium CA13]|uniref:SF3 helicase domain-containing protein n=1 Tax=Novipirellula herctigrandis TaxID=2527986 RepID=A0A5C5YMU1_9BACT|nr:hypothetical protein CA13_66940 [Planctomycetes bacterium CA13]
MSKQSTDTLAFLSWLHEPGDVFEIRSIKCPDANGSKWTATVAGWFDDPKQASQAVEMLEQRQPPAIYVTLNPCDDALLARGNNRLIEKASQTTSDHDIQSRRWLFVDIDPVRPAGVSSTQSEHDHAEQLAERIRAEMTALGWSEPLFGMSGNGFYLLYRINLTNDADSTALVGSVLAELKSRFDTEHAEVDTTAVNSARIVKVLGTVARKGEHYQPADKPQGTHRPHRQSWFVIPHTMPQIVTAEQLRAFAGDQKEPTVDPMKKKNGLVLPDKNEWDLRQWIDDHNVPVGKSRPWKGSGRRWVLNESIPGLCTHDADGAAFITQGPTGAIAAGCQHDHCTWDWRDLRQHYEPGCYDANVRQKAGKADPPQTIGEGSKDDTGDLLSESGRTDAANADRFIDRFATELLYIPPWRKWLTWDGARWHDDDGIGVMQRAKRYGRNLWHKLAEAAQHVDRDELGRIQTYVKSTNHRRRIEDFTCLAAVDERIVCVVDELNEDPNLLNVANGTVDLSTGCLRAHNPADRITQLANVVYDPTATCQKWIETLNLIFSDDAELIGYVQKLLGYSMTGDTGEHILPIAYGSGCNGKSTIWNVVTELLGDYAGLANDALLLGDKDNHPTEKASLYQKRFMAISEPERGASLREARVKELTGDRTITARRMHEDFWSFDRTHTFWLSTNHLPRIDGIDDGIWRRVKLIPFLVDLRTKVKPIADFDRWLVTNEGPGILNWLVQGHLAYQREGLQEPQTVVDATKEYRTESDPLGEFLAEYCVVEANAIAPAAELYRLYSEEHKGRWSKTAFGRAMAERFDKLRGWQDPYRGKVIYEGLRLRKTDDFHEDPSESESQKHRKKRGCTQLHPVSPIAPRVLPNSLRATPELGATRCKAKNEPHKKPIPCPRCGGAMEPAETAVGGYRNYDCKTPGCAHVRPVKESGEAEVAQ